MSSNALNAPKAALITITKSESFYLTDGDIVLFSLPKDNVVTAFRVDRVFLRRSSPVLEGMLALPSSKDVELYDNVPLIKLQDETEHLTMFLNALYDPGCLPWKKHDADTVRTVEGILLLANKYEADHLRKRIIDLLERDWPSELSDWDINEAELAVKAESGTFRTKNSILDPCEAIRLARKCDVPSILPAAFYYLSSIQGVSDRHLPDSLEKILSKGSGLGIAGFSLLSAEDLRCLLVGRDAILHLFRDYFREADGKVRSYIKHSNLDHEDCQRRWRRFEDGLRLEVLHYDIDPLLVMKRDTDSFEVRCLAERPCDHCLEEFFSSLSRNREILWEQLPSLFMLDS
ncbi:hypothetical protein Clacol_007923 [Clathrus columnatus]|uniref:BTB domain-containing protein n=1 Tax=Clathrus columnatus TaxID=1419009 RepID=A0AAV5AG91_9AGAM|nr:hypothetical protein Clacol_007923 [Clathrus columnatus]